MRTVRTFVLRLLVDPAEPGAIRGALQAMPEGGSQPFSDEQGLLALLRQMVLPTMGAPDSETTGRANVKREGGRGT